MVHSLPGEALPLGQLQTQGPCQECGHLSPGHVVAGAEPGVTRRIAALGDPGAGDLLDRGLEDGVVVVPQDVEEQVVAAAWKKVHDENVTRDAIRAGMSATAAYKKYGVL